MLKVFVYTKLQISSPKVSKIFNLVHLELNTRETAEENALKKEKCRAVINKLREDHPSALPIQKTLLLVKLPHPTVLTYLKVLEAEGRIKFRGKLAALFSIAGRSITNILLFKKGG